MGDGVSEKARYPSKDRRVYPCPKKMAERWSSPDDLFTWPLYTVSNCTVKKNAPGLNLSPLQASNGTLGHSRKDDIISLLLSAAAGDGREMNSTRHKGPLLAA